MTPPPPPLDIVTLAIAVATLLFGPAAAQLVGPYAVIALGALLGAAWSASRREPNSQMSTLAHMAVMVGVALLLTVPGASLAAKYLGLEDRWLFGPVAVVIAGIGQDWPRIGAWAAGLVRGIVERWVSRKAGGDQP